MISSLNAAIRIAVDQEGWVVEAVTPGMIIASLRVRSHKAVVTIGFDESNFWIDYLDSTNLKYRSDEYVQHLGSWLNGPVIHGNYNLWVKLLAKSIAIYARNPTETNSTYTVPSKAPILIADELEKLDALRERGVLSQEEFDQQKMKLLAQ